MKERDIISVLKGFQKPMLEDICYLLGSEASYRPRKKDMAEALGEYLHGKPRRWLNCLLERDLRLLKTLVAGGPEKVQFIELGHYHSLLEVSGLVEVTDDEQRFQQVTLPREVYDIVAPYVDEAIEKGEKSGRFEFERAALGFLNLYGRVDVQVFLDFIQEWCDAGYGPGLKRLLVQVQDSPLIKMCRFTDEYGDYMLSPCVDNLPKLVEDRKSFGFESEQLKKLPVEAAIEAGEGAPFFTLQLETPEGKALVEMLRSIGYEGSELTRIEHEIWLDAQAEEGGDLIYDSVYAKDEAIRSDSEFMRCLQVIADYANSIPLWRLCGYSAADENMVIFFLPDEFQNPVTPEETESSAPTWNMPRPTVSEGYTQAAEDQIPENLLKLLPGGFPFGMAVPPAAPDDPCPCGSGLRYKHCHGKIRN
ncbi:MAG: SEC-C domain-containing protein [Bacteroidales bacterium]|nr:SEC-C domain-containing protein [Bacteroidales bacterium]